MSLFVLALLGQLQGFALSNSDGGAEKYVRHINCSGAGIYCDPGTSTFGTIRVTGGGSGITVPTCAGNQATTANGSSFSCVSNIATATALASNPTDCGFNQYATTIDASGNLTCTQVSYSQILGNVTAGGSSPQVQFNNVGILGGISNVTSDGTHLQRSSETSFASAPSAGTGTTQDWAPATTVPGIPFRVDGTFGTIPEGVLEVFGEGASGSNWQYQCGQVAQAGATTLTMTNGPAVTAGAWSSTVTWANTSLLARIPWIRGGASGVANATGSLIQTGIVAWRGNAAGAGGFIFWTRAALHLANSAGHTRWMFGLQNLTSAWVNEPSVVTDDVYFGADNGQTTLHICSNDNAGSATCTDLGSNYPTTTNDAIYDMWLWAPPNGSTIGWYINRLDVANTTNGTISSDLPRNTVQLTFTAEVNTADGGSTNPSGGPIGYLNGYCLAYNY